MNATTETNLTMATVMAAFAELPPPPQWKAMAVRPDVFAAIRRDKRIFPGGTRHLPAITIGVKHGQVAASWAFSDEATLRKYLNDELTELDLMELVRAGTVQPQP